MTVLRINKKEKNFLILDKTCLTEITLSWGAKGLHSYLMSLPVDWQVNVNDLKNRATNGRDSVRGLLNELQNFGYITKEWVRDDATGKYSCLEYVVHELPQHDIMIEGPGTGNPETAFPSPANPATEKPTLININNTKDTNNKELTAANQLEKNFRQESKKSAAAVFSTQNNKTYLTTSLAEDSVIGNILTANQQTRIDLLVQEIKTKLTLNDPNKLVDEIQHCLLSKKHFTACNQDFGKKLNAIRKVILRGGWQTPADMASHIITTKDSSGALVEQLKKELTKYHAEANHFGRLINNANKEARINLEGILKKVIEKTKDLETKIQYELTKSLQTTM